MRKPLARLQKSNEVIGRDASCRRRWLLSGRPWQGMTRAVEGVQRILPTDRAEHSLAGAQTAFLEADLEDDLMAADFHDRRFPGSNRYRLRDEARPGRLPNGSPPSREADRVPPGEAGTVPLPPSNCQDAQQPKQSSGLLPAIRVRVASIGNAV